MSDQTHSSIIFGADFDSKAFVTGVDAMIAAGKKLQAQADALKQTAEDQGKAFDDNVAKMKKLETQISQLEKSEKESTYETKRLKAELQALVKANDDLGKAIAKGGAALAKTKAQNDNLQQAYARTRKMAAELQDQAGKPVKMNIDDGKVINALQTLKTKFDTAFADAGVLLTVGELEKLDKAIIESNGEFEQIAKTIGILQQKLLTLEPGTAQFDEVSAAIRSGNGVLKEYTKLYSEATNEVEKSEPKYKSLRAQIAALRNELTKMEEAGEDNTERFRQTQIQAARLSDQLGDTNRQIAILASDTKGLDFGVAAIETAVAGYQTLISAQELFGLSTEDSEKVQAKLLAVMNLVAGIRELKIKLLKEETLRTIGASAAGKAYTATQAALTTVLRGSVIAAKALTAALAVTGVGLAAFAIVELVSAVSKFNKASEDSTRITKNLAAISNKAADSYAEGTFRLTRMIEKVKQGNLSFKQKEKAVKEFNDEFGKTLGSVKDYAELEKRLIASGPDYIKYLKTKADAQAAFDLAVESSKKKLQAENSTPQENLSGTQNFLYDANDFIGQSDYLNKLFNLKEENKKLDAVANENKAAQIEKAAKDVVFFTGKLKVAEDEAQKLSDRLKLKPDEDKKTKDVENIFKKELARLNTALRKAIRNGFTSDSTIAEDFADDLQKQLDDVAEAVKKKQLTKAQAAIITGKIRQLVTINKKQVTEDFHKQLADVQRGIERELEDLSFQDSEKRLEAIYDGFEKEGAAISLALERQQKDIARQQEDINNRLAEGLARGSIKPEAYERLKKQFAAYFGRLAEDAAAEAARRKGELAEKIFQDGLDELNRQIKGVDLLGGEVMQQELTELTAKYLQGQLSYESFQEQLTAIQKKFEEERKQRALKGLQSQIEAIQQRLNDSSVNLSQEQRKAEEEQVQQLIEAYQNLNAEILGDKVEKKKTADDKRIQRLQEYVSYAGEIISSIGQAWLTVNQMEQESLNRSLSMQGERVEAARRLAERGNASYLKMEEEKQQELLLKQEAAARRQIAINAAVQASSIITGVAGSIASLVADPTGVNLVKNLALIVGALTSGYALVKSLQQNQPSFYEGTDYVEGRRDFTKNTKRVNRLKEPSGRDTIPAWLHEGESVNDAKTTEKYKDVIHAMHEGTLPPDFFSRQIEAMYPRTRIPMLNTDRMDAAINFKVIQDARLFDAIQENTKEVKRMRKEMSKSKVTTTVDSNGVAQAVEGYLATNAIHKKI